MVDITNWLRAQWIPAQRCLYCGQAGSELACPPCARELPWNVGACRACAIPLRGPSAVCARCLRRAPVFDATFAAFRYEAPIRQSIHGLKYEAQFRHGRLLGRLMAQRLSSRPAPMPQLLLPVPLHASRLRARGYNQAQLLALDISRVLAVPVQPGLARRVRATPDQVGSTATERRRNLRGAFAVDSLQGRHVALVDDVMTTGATLTELARACRRAGAATVEAWVAARAG